jgi:hypothetical protein
MKRRVWLILLIGLLACAPSPPDYTVTGCVDSAEEMLFDPDGNALDSPQYIVTIGSRTFFIDADSYMDVKEKLPSRMGIDYWYAEDGIGFDVTVTILGPCR